MSLVKQCDRCKAVYQNNTVHEIAGDRYIERVEGIEIMLKGNTGEVSGRCIDLCDDCIKELSEWFEENRNGRKR